MMPHGFGPPPEVVEEMMAQYRAYEEAEAVAELAHRLNVLRFASMMCSCRPWWEWRAGMGQEVAAGCPIHGVLVLASAETLRTIRGRQCPR